MPLGELLPIGVLGILIAGLLWRGLGMRRAQVPEAHVGLLYRSGRFSQTLAAGGHWVWRWARELTLVDLRERILAVASQELLSKDHVPVKLSAACRFAITDAPLAMHGVEKYQANLYLAIQLVLRDAVAELSVDELLQQRTALGEHLRDRVGARAQLVGLEVRDVAVKDVILSGELKRALGAPYLARQEGQAMLERARGEQAALRSLANSARLLDGNPNLLQLRLLAAVEGAAKGPGVTLVLGGNPPPGGTDRPAAAAAGSAAPPASP